jgi:hypothetical protein
MKVIIAGSRHIRLDLSHIDEIVAASGFKITEVVSSDCGGVANDGEFWGVIRKLRTNKFAADWPNYGKAAGPLRNRQMADYADSLIAVWDGKSPDTKNMIDHMRRRKKPVYIHYIRGLKSVPNQE